MPFGTDVLLHADGVPDLEEIALRRPFRELHLSVVVDGYVDP